MLRLKDRNRQIPNGFRFKQPETGWQPPRFASFETIVQGLMTHRKGNHALAEKHRWALDHDSIANEVDHFNAKMCSVMGWNDFITTGGEPSPPLFQPPQSQSQKQSVVAGANVKWGKNMAAGLKLYLDWFGRGAIPVAASHAESRAAICVTCPKHVKGDWKQRWSQSMADEIMSVVGVLKDLNLSTRYDEQLQICDACDCPMRAKVWSPVEVITAHMRPEARGALWEQCWIPKEEEKLKKQA